MKKSFFGRGHLKGENWPHIVNVHAVVIEHLAHRRSLCMGVVGKAILSVQQHPGW